MIDTTDKMELKYMSATIDRFEGQNAVIKTSDGQQLIWPTQNLPADTTEGQVIKLSIANNESEQKEREKNAKAILSEILNINES